MPKLSHQTIFLEKTVYQDFGAGLPHTPGPGQTMSTGDGHIVISGYHKALPSFEVRVGRIARHTLLLPREGAAEGKSARGMTREIPLAELAPPAAPLPLRWLRASARGLQSGKRNGRRPGA